MLENLTQQPADKILMLMGMYKADTRPDKIDLGVGVYRNAEGVTPVPRAIKAAERKLWEIQDTKAYTGLTGDPAYAEAMATLILGERPAEMAAAATPGGTGAVRQCFELIQLENPGATVWVSDPTWPNHLTMLKHLGLNFRQYRYFDDATRSVDYEGMVSALLEVQPGDVVLLHGCCHNPTGANLTLDQWKKIAQLLNDRQATPMIDIAYQGFGDGLDADAAGVRHLAKTCPEMIIAASCSKNFGIYRERAGLVIALTPNHAIAQGTLSHLNRQNYSFPPDHGARLVTMILNDPELKADWMAELEDMRLGMLAIREQLAAELKRLTNTDQFDFVAHHRGMFSRLGLSPEQVEKLREEHAIYMVGDSRVNIAGLNADTVPVLAKAIAEVVSAG